MLREELVDLNAFVTVADEASFTRAAAKLNTSQSALSYTLKRLEERLGVRLLVRTTRSVAPTEAGERLLATLRPALDDIGLRLAELTELREKPSGTVRITSGDHAAETLLLPAVAKLMPDYPDIHVEVMIDNRFVDIVAERFDAGIRLGEHLAKDMVASRIGPDLRMVVVGAPSYFESHPVPLSPHDLTGHNCINTRMPTHGGLYVWEFTNEGRAVNVRVEGQLTFNSGPLRLKAALAGLGLAFLMEDHVADHVAAGRLVPVLASWCQPFPGYHLYHPSRRQPSPAFAVVANALRHRG